MVDAQRIWLKERNGITNRLILPDSRILRINYEQHKV
jgi:hypothetical protein